MPAGTQTSGQSLGGLDAPGTIARRPIVQVAAKVYDPVAKKFLVDEYGQYESQHPVDGWVVLQLTLIHSSLPSALDVGNPGLTVTHQGRDYVQTVKNRILTQLQPKIASGEIIVRRVEVTPLARQGAAIETEYKNLVTNAEFTTVRL